VRLKSEKKKTQEHALKEVTQQQWIVVITIFGEAKEALQISPR